MKNKYLIQLHDATRLHYDLRLEIDGVLASWALPKGPSTNPEEKRLAIQTPDHPLSYGSFEGVIEEGYGKGPVMLWDTGYYEPKNKDIPMHQQLAERKIEIFIHGKKLKGLWALIGFGDEADKWLFIKMHDEYESKKDITKGIQKSAVSDKTMEEIK